MESYALVICLGFPEKLRKGMSSCHFCFHCYTVYVNHISLMRVNKIFRHGKGQMIENGKSVP